jgi:hypothetical protein
MFSFLCEEARPVLIWAAEHEEAIITGAGIVAGWVFSSIWWASSMESRYKSLKGRLKEAEKDIDNLAEKLGTVRALARRGKKQHGSE